MTVTLGTTINLSNTERKVKTLHVNSSVHLDQKDERNSTRSLVCEENEGQFIEGYFQRKEIFMNKQSKVWNHEDVYTGYFHRQFFKKNKVCSEQETGSFISVHLPTISFRKVENVETLEGKHKDTIYSIARKHGTHITTNYHGYAASCFHVSWYSYRKTLTTASQFAYSAVTVGLSHDIHIMNSTGYVVISVNVSQYLYSETLTTVLQFDYSSVTVGLSYKLQKGDIENGIKSLETKKPVSAVMANPQSSAENLSEPVLKSKLHISAGIKTVHSTSCAVFCDDVSLCSQDKILTNALQLACSSVTGGLSLVGLIWKVSGIGLIFLLIIFSQLPLTAYSDVNKCTDELSVHPHGRVEIGRKLTISCPRKITGTPRWEKVHESKASIIALNTVVYDTYKDNFTVMVTTEWSNMTINEVTMSNLDEKYVCHVGNYSQSTRKLLEYDNQLKIPANVTVIAISDTMIVVLWEQEKMEGCMEHTTCRIEYRTEGTSFWTYVDVDVSGLVGSLNYTLSSLMPGKEYELRIYAYNEVGRSNSTNSLLAKTISKDDQQNDSGDTTGIIIGVVFGMMCIIAVVCFYFCCKKKANSSQKVCSCCGNLFNKNCTSKSRGVYSQTAHDDNIS